MKKYFLLVILSSVLFACGKKDDKSAGGGGGGDKPAVATGGGDCVVGEYWWDDNGTKRGFVLNADKSGKEVYEVGKDERPLTWSIKDDKMVHLKYTSSENVAGGEFDVPYNCAAGSFGSVATPYKKK
jgi:hypothetical protein